MSSTSPAVTAATPSVVVERLRAGRLSSLSAALGPGLYTLWAPPERGTAELVELLAGVRSPLRGSVHVAGHAPYVSPATRARIGALLPHETLGQHGSVASYVKAALLARADTTTPSALLAQFGIESWAERPLLQLEPREARALSLALALTVPAPPLVVLYEPLARVAALPQVHLARRLFELGHSSCVLAVTASESDAQTLGGVLLTLDGERLLPSVSPSSSEPGSDVGIDLRVRTPEARRLLQALVNGTPSPNDISGVSWDAEHAEDEVIVRGAPADRVALCVAAAVHAHAIPIVDWRSAPLSYRPRSGASPS